MLIALLHGVSFATAPILSFGPFKIFVLSTALDLGWRRTLHLALTPLLADIPVILLIWFLLVQLPAGFVDLLKIAGGVFYIYLAAVLIRRMRSPTNSLRRSDQERKSFLQSMFMIWVTPNVYINWSIVGVPALISYADETAANAAAFLLGFYLLWIAGLALQIFIAGQAGGISTQAPRVLVYAGSLLLVGFGLFQIWEGLRNVFFA